MVRDRINDDEENDTLIIIIIINIIKSLLSPLNAENYIFENKQTNKELR